MDKDFFLKEVNAQLVEIDIIGRYLSISLANLKYKTIYQLSTQLPKV